MTDAHDDELQMTEVFDLTQVRLDGFKDGEQRRLYQMVEYAYRLTALAHDAGVEMVVSPAAGDQHVAARYSVHYPAGLSLSIYVAALRQTLIDLTGRW
jgi:hypothetical protein